MAEMKPFLPTTRAEMNARGWDELDVLLVTGDAYVDHPSFGAAVVGRVLEAEGWRVGVVAQPDWADPASLTVMGRPRLFCGVTAGNLDSMLAHYTAARRRRKEDAYTPGGAVARRPNMAAVVYAQLARRAFPGVPTVLGGIEASLRRTAHYDYWRDQVRPSILADAKADILVYGMGERAVVEIARRIARALPLDGIAGTARMPGARESDPDLFANCVLLPSLEECRADIRKVREATRLTEREQNPFCGRPLVQRHGARAVRIEPPAPPLDTADLDRVYGLPFVRAPHPSCGGPVPAFTMIRDSVTVVRGCAGGCSFCGLGLHQGRFLSSRSEESILGEVRAMAGSPGFSGTVTDLGGPTANLYGCVNGAVAACRVCRRASCLFPAFCPHLELHPEAAIRLMRRVGEVAGVRHVFIQSGIRMDVALESPEYVRELARHHVSGHLKVAPEHLHPRVLRKMRKPGPETFHAFREAFEAESRAAGRRQYLVPYFISNFPGSTEREMEAVEHFVRREGWNLQQVQDFIPLPMTPAAAVYATGLDYETGEPVPVVRGLAGRRAQMRQLRPRTPGPRRGRPPHSSG
ncbi:MAG: YgiQ family radical SAM protein [Acidobacteria bacterium]|nr:YgiQ family radical SAM protein [Acidobacteriota bacterium]